jgi:uroporphyrinogen-III synthase
MRVIVTRPAAQAADWVNGLRERGLDAVALPLIEIASPDEPQRVHEAWRDLHLFRLVVFVSPNAVDSFFATRPAGIAWPEGVLAATVGPGSSRALRRHGVPDGAIVEPPDTSVRFESETLWQQLEGIDWHGKRAAIVRGDGGREWLAQRLSDHGAAVEFIPAYKRLPALVQGERLRILMDALARPREHLWHFSSSEGLGHLVDAAPNASWVESRAMATHLRIAERARQCGFGSVHEAAPTLDAVVCCIQSLAS